MRSYRGQVAIVGVGETPVGKVPGRSALWFNAEATRLALEDAGLDKSRVDGLVTAPSFVAPFARMSVAASTWVCMSASMCLITWNSPIARPN